MKRRLVRVGLSFSFIVELIHDGALIPRAAYNCTKGIPRDSRYVSSYFDHDAQVAYIVLEHESFAEVEEGDVIPVFGIEFNTVIA